MYVSSGIRAVAATTIMQHSVSLPKGLHARLLESDDLEQLISLRSAVLSQLDHVDYYRPENEPDGFVEDHLDRLGQSIGIFHDNRLVAYAALGLPGPEESSLVLQAGLDPKHYAHVAHLAAVMVTQGYRSQNLQRWLAKLRIKIAAELGCRHILSTVSPLNHTSWGNLAACAVYPCQLLKPKKPGATPRFLLHRDLKVTLSLNHATAKLVPVSRIHLDENLFQNGVKIWANLKLTNGAFAIVACSHSIQNDETADIV